VLPIRDGDRRLGGRRSLGRTSNRYRSPMRQVHSEHALVPSMTAVAATVLQPGEKVSAFMRNPSGPLGTTARSGGIRLARSGKAPKYAHIEEFEIAVADPDQLVAAKPGELFLGGPAGHPRE
jgi:hypothetical protein